MFRVVGFLLLPVALSSATVGQTQPKDSSKPDPAALLKEVKDKYTQAKSYNIEAIEEFEFRDDLSHQWDKSFFNAAVASGNRYRFEGRASHGWTTKISDGRTEWIFDRDADMYTQKPAPDQGPSQMRIITMNLSGLYRAQNLVKTLSKQPSNLLDPAYFPDEILTVNGRQVQCYVIGGRGRYSGGSRDTTRQLTFWIEKEKRVVRKVHVHAEGALMVNNPYHRLIEDETTAYPVVELDSPSLPDSIFRFEPPAEAKLVDEFPDPMKAGGAALVGKAAPDVKVRSSDGQIIALTQFRGKPVLLEFWATWCAPCVSSLPSLAKLFKETSEKGLVLLSVDEDEDAKTAADFWNKRAEPWPNFHDADGEVQRAFAPGGVPEFVLIDPTGKITYTDSGFDEPALRAAIAKLGPEFASVATTSKP
jgi:cytochrome c biogenesis protein CcmG/thiol:disulfide interchange protein DsbE